MIKNQSACSQTVVYKLTTSPVKPFVKELTVATIDNDVQNSLFYRANGDLYDRYFPIGIEMIRFFNVIGTINEGEQEQVPELPPLSNTSDLNAIINMAGPKITFRCVAAFEGWSHFIANKRINEQIAKLMGIVTD